MSASKQPSNCSPSLQIQRTYEAKNNTVDSAVFLLVILALLGIQIGRYVDKTLRLAIKFERSRDIGLVAIEIDGNTYFEWVGRWTIIDRTADNSSTTLASRIKLQLLCPLMIPRQQRP